MWAEIFKKLDVKSLGSARQTCKFWTKIIDERKIMEKALGKFLELKFTQCGKTKNSLSAKKIS